MRLIHYCSPNVCVVGSGLTNLGGHYRKNEEERVSCKIDSLESQIQELPSRSWLLKNQSPTTSMHEPEVSPKGNEKSSHSGKLAPTSPTVESSKAYSKSLVTPIFLTNHKNYWGSKGYLKNAERERRVFTPLSNVLSTMCVGLIKDNLIARAWSKPSTSIPTVLNLHARCYCDMDASRHKIEFSRDLRHKIHDLRDEG